MHKIFLWSSTLVFGIMSFVFFGCSKDNSQNRDSDRSGIVTFRMETPDLQVFTKTSGKVQENGTTTDKFAFYQFSGNGEFERCYTTDYSAMRPDGSSTLVYDLFTGKFTGVKKFVIVRSSTSESFPNLQLGETIDYMLDARTASSDGNKVFPCVMSSLSADGNPWIQIDAVESAVGETAVSMPRNVARIDIINNPEESGVEIEKVFVKNARSTGYIAQTMKPTEDFYSSVLEMPASSLSEGKSFYLYPTVLSGKSEQDTKTVIWATTKLAGSSEVGPEIKLAIDSDIEVKSNYIYEMRVNAGNPGNGFELTEQDWTDGSQSDWLPAGSGITLPNDKAEIIEGTVIKGTYVKVGPEASLPYKITKTVIDSDPQDIKMTSDNDFPYWLDVKSSTMAVGENIYRHDVVFTVSDPSPGDHTRFAITYPEGSEDDSEIMSFGFIDPYPGTPLPCLSWGSYFYSPVHAGQEGYLKRNLNEKAFYAGKTGYTIEHTANMINDVAVNPCPEGWRPVTDREAKEFLSWVGSNLKNKMGKGIYTYNLFGNPSEATNVRIFAGYARSAGPEYKDIACFGTWPNVAWLQIDEENLKVLSTTYDNEWVVDKDYGIPYRCIRSK